jgi:hypothetical protein
MSFFGPHCRPALVTWTAPDKPRPEHPSPRPRGSGIKRLSRDQLENLVWDTPGNVKYFESHLSDLEKGEDVPV